MAISNAKQKIIPHLWFDSEAEEAAEFYVSLFPDSKVTNVTILPDTPSGDSSLVSFEILGYRFMAISGGPHFKLNPSVSIMVNFNPTEDKDAKKTMDEVWDKLSEGGTALMPLDKYPFSEKYGWIQDKYGLTWQLLLRDVGVEEHPPVMPSLMFVGDVCGKASEAIEFYSTLFKNAEQGFVARYPKNMEPDKEGTIMYADFILENQWFSANESAREHQFSFNEATSFIVYCDSQDEIDYYWEKLSAVPEAEQCGWLKDQYGLSWQIMPREMDEMMSNGSPQQIASVTKAFLEMKKLDLEALKRAYNL